MQNTIYMPFSASVIKQAARMWIAEQKEQGDELAFLVHDLLSIHDNASDFSPPNDEPDEWTEKWGEIERMILETVASMLKKGEPTFKRYAECHPDYPHYSKGMCRKCYNASRWKVWYGKKGSPFKRRKRVSIDPQLEGV